MEFDLKQIGITEEELADRVVARIADGLLYHDGTDEDGDRVTGIESEFGRKMKERLEEAIQQAVDAIAEKSVVPALIGKLETLDFQPQSRYGEPKGEPITYKEYLAARADEWLSTEVDYEGREKGDRQFYGDRGRKTTRAAWLVNKYFSNTVESALKEAVAAANEKISEGLEKAIAIKIREIAAGLKVDIKPAR